MADGLTPEQEKEVEALNLTPMQREILVEALTNSPGLTVQEAHEMLKAAGGI